MYEVGKKFPLPRVDIPSDGGLTSEYYKTRMIPDRFNNPHWFTGYGCQKRPPENLMYRTTSNAYGWYPPNMHTVPTVYFPISQAFSNHLAAAGMYRNFSLNTALDTSIVS